MDKALGAYRISAGYPFYSLITMVPGAAPGRPAVDCDKDLTEHGAKTRDQRIDL